MLLPHGLSFQNIHKEFQQNLDYIFYPEVGGPIFIRTNPNLTHRC